ncbi:MAG: hypothetical protein AB3N14_16680 [Flavobacteriaceae bacterium]
MDVIVLGVYNDQDKEKLDNLFSSLNDLEIIWNYEIYDLESSAGLLLLRQSYNLNHIGILVEKNKDSVLTSYPLIYEVTETFMGINTNPIFFGFLVELENLGLKKMVLAFADEWDTDTLVRIEKSNFKSLKERLNTPYVWCESLTSLISQTKIRDDGHPLIFEVSG